MWTGRNNIVDYCQCGFDLYPEFFKEDGRECLQWTFAVHCRLPTAGQRGSLPSAGKLLQVTWAFPALASWEWRVGSLLSSACCVCSPCNLNLERLVNAGAISSGSRVTKITKISFLDSASCTHATINTWELSLYFGTFCTDTSNGLLPFVHMIRTLSFVWQTLQAIARWYQPTVRSAVLIFFLCNGGLFIVI